MKAKTGVKNKFFNLKFIFRMESFTRSSINVFPVALQQLHQFTLNNLPIINDKIVAGGGCVYEIIQQVNKPLRTLVDTYQSRTLTRDVAIDILRCVAPVISSIQRHLVTYNYKQEHFSNLLECNIENFLLDLGRVSGLPPRDSVYTTWLLNDNPVYRFDTNAGWLFFWKAVRLTNSNFLEANKAIDTIICQNWAITSGSALDAIAYATEKVNEVFTFYQGFVKGGMETDYFANVFRTYFLSYRIGDKQYIGSNATNVASVPALDFKIGVYNEKYKAIVENRFIQLAHEDIMYIKTAMKEPSLLQLLIEYLGFDYYEFVYFSIDEIRAKLNKGLITPDFKQAYTSVTRLIKIVASWSKQHFGLINTFLVKQANNVESCPLGFTAPAVEYTHGVGGASHEETKSIRDMRANHFLIKKLDAIIY
ncbi:hypothetical protein A3860_18480 [Niastella vici]|uniref:Uncharacterized protein n=1 Tax=Niastella vici TaxID=1703345 RepID=A0A1V9G2Q7_9BACT|nr:monodechloroaminopyrrolnitrin synthase PrnB family protein [Niastella vici]OQP64746.1 hypothetical protein A3860_18480 [Niastella vici]